MKKFILFTSLLFSLNAFADAGFIPTKHCAILWAHADFDQFRRPGGVLLLADEQRTSNLRTGPNRDYPDFNDEISALSVKRGCRLYAYDHSNFTGFLQKFEGNKVYSYTSPNPNYKLHHNDRYSALFCTCEPDFGDDVDLDELARRIREVAGEIMRPMSVEYLDNPDY